MIAVCRLTPEHQARQRVKNTPELQKYSEILLDYSWPNMEEHYHWVATGDTDRIFEWCKDILCEDS